MSDEPYPDLTHLDLEGAPDEVPVHSDPESGQIRVFIGGGLTLNMTLEQARELGITLVEVAAIMRQLRPPG